MGDIVSKLKQAVDPARVIIDPERLEELSWDALSAGRLHPKREPPSAAPLCAVMPACTEEVRRIVNLANAEKTPLVPYGGGSGLMGGALSIRPSIIVDLRAMNRIIEIDIEARSARAQSGIVLERLDQRLNEEGFILGHDPWTVPVATLGGAIATNSVGYRAGAYGSMGAQVLGLEAVLPNGEILRTRAVEKSSAGINLNALLIGSEGCFGIITEASIRIFPQPETRLLHALHFANFETGYRAIQKMFLQGLRPALLDFGDSDYDGGALLYLGFEGIKERTLAEGERALSVCLSLGASALPQAEAERFWRERHAIARRFLSNRRERRERGKGGVYRDWIHVALPASKVLAFRKAAIELIERRGVRLHESGLWIQPELFSMPLIIESSSENHQGPDGQLVLEETVEELLRLVQHMGGSMEYTHGVGIKLAPLMAAELGYGLDVLRAIKRNLDPNNIMNPGKMAL
ncbi:MAG TPA: FAD-binding oxidoreductase [Candidatus Binatia bacterium]|nr:FAD-binding oxidoreductase [Candidatus Binatia bacterium]